MDGNKKVYAIRHGESTGNKARMESFNDGNGGQFDAAILDTNPDHWELTELGVEQAKKVGDFIRNVLLLNPAVYVSSNTARARQTAGHAFPDAIANVNEPLVKERNYGGYEKLSKAEWFKKLAEAGVSASEDSYDWKVPDGESAREAQVRAQAFLKKITELKAFIKEIESVASGTDETFVFTHGDLIQVLRVILHDISPEKYVAFKQAQDNYVRNGQIFVFTIDNHLNLVSEETFFHENGHWYTGTYSKEKGIMEKSMMQPRLKSDQEKGGNSL